LDHHPPLSEDAVRFYGAQIALGLRELHSMGFVYRDLKPENVLIDHQGNVRISDFGLAKNLARKRDFLHDGYAGTRGYLAPEVVARHRYSFEIDFWAFGVLLYELLHKRVSRLRVGGCGAVGRDSLCAPASQRPFKENEQPQDMKFANVSLRRGLSERGKNLLSRLLENDAVSRLGHAQNLTKATFGRSWEQVMTHPFFEEIDWAKMERKEYPPPYVPAEGVMHCSMGFEAEEQLLATSERDRRESLLARPDVFRGFSFNVELHKPSAAAHSAPAGGDAAAAAVVMRSASDVVSAVGVDLMGDGKGAKPPAGGAPGTEGAESGASERGDVKDDAETLEEAYEPAPYVPEDEIFSVDGHAAAGPPPPLPTPQAASSPSPTASSVSAAANSSTASGASAAPKRDSPRKSAVPPLHGADEKAMHHEPSSDRGHKHAARPHVVASQPQQEQPSAPNTARSVGAAAAGEDTEHHEPLLPLPTASN
jgi:hypothetical protein